MAHWFSVVLPVYNVAQYLERCVESVLSQGFSDYELILVDDGATDGSGELCDCLAEKHSCIRVIHKENGGLSSARNAGLEAAKGRYIWYVDADDWIQPDSLEILYRQTRDSLPDMVKINHIRVEGQTSKVMYSSCQPGSYIGQDCEKLLQQACYRAGKFVLSACMLIYRRTFLTENQLSFVSERVVGSEDYLFNLECYLLAKSVTVLPDALYNYWMRIGSITQRYKPGLPEKYEKLYEMLRQRFEKAGAWHRYEGWLSAFYVWHLIRGTCIPNSYWSRESGALKAGRKEIRAFLRLSSCRAALASCDKTPFSRKEKTQLFLMRLGAEPVFYWLYVVKPKLEKGKTHENKT